MPKRYERITNVHKLALIKTLKKASKKNNARIWRYIAELLERPRRLKVEVNLSKLDLHTKDGDIVVVPGKVLGGGKLNHKITIAAFSFSESAKRKLLDSGSRLITIEELINERPRGSGVKIII